MPAPTAASPDDTRGAASASPAATERRQHLRVPFPAEVLILWHHAPERARRHRLCNASDGGMAILAVSELPRGTTGTAIRLVPEGTELERSVAVAWSGDAGAAGLRTVGLRFF
jgi:hypothetical protein